MGCGIGYGAEFDGGLGVRVSVITWVALVRAENAPARCATFRTPGGSRVEGEQRRPEGDRWGLRAHRGLHRGRSEGCRADHLQLELMAFAPTGTLRYRNRLRSKLGFSHPPFAFGDEIGTWNAVSLVGEDPIHLYYLAFGKVRPLETE